MTEEVTKIYWVQCEEDFKEVPTDGSALVMWYEDLYVCCHDGWWRIVEHNLSSEITIIDLTKPVPFTVEKGYIPILGKQREKLKNE